MATETEDIVDLQLKCKRCLALFTFNVGEQRFFARHGLVPPTHCKPCRTVRTVDVPSPSGSTAYADQTRSCAKCRQPFVFEAGEQEFFARHGLRPPAICPACRALRRLEAPWRPAAPRAQERPR
jgi:hypothetical protein